MSTTLEAPPRPAARPPAAPRPRPGGGPGRESAVLMGVGALLAGAVLSLGRVFIGWDALQPALVATAVAVGVTWGCHRLGAGPVITLLGALLGWVAFVSIAFFPDTLAGGVAPTWATMEAAATTWERGIELVRARPAPAFPEPELLFLTVAGVWAVAYLCTELTFRLEAPLRAIGVAMVLWGVPVTIGPRGLEPWPLTVPLLAGAALLLLAFASSDVGRWGPVCGHDGPPARQWNGTHRRADAGPKAGWAGLFTPSGWLVAGVAIAAGVACASALPGFGDRPLYDIRRGAGGGAVTGNPIVSVRANLVAPNQGAVLRVSSPRPVYLRTTSLDVYSENEEWTNDGIRGAPVADGALTPEKPIAQAEVLDVRVTVEDLAGALLVPAPYQPVGVGGPASRHFQYDRERSTLLLSEGNELVRGDEYTVSAAIPNPEADALAALSHDELRAAGGDRLVALPGDVPDSVAALAREIVVRSGADSPFAQALAIQSELRSWEYSLDPPPGHSSRALESFIDSRVGYCEQYAAAMAVMLRTLDVPARVAVGYTPGQRIDEGDDDSDRGEYAVTRTNAHAWVEVLFAGYGWVAFEPTPRDDGDVLVPSAANLAPDDTAGAGAGSPVDDRPAQLDDSALLSDPSLTGERADAADAADGSATGQVSSGGSERSGLPVLALLAALAAGASIGGVAVAARKAGYARSTRRPPERVLDARERVELVGRGLGIRPRPWETDREYLERLAGDDPDAGVLATHVAQARWAGTGLPAESADTAEGAAQRLRERLLSNKSPAGRRMVTARGAIDAAWAAVPVEVRRRSGLRTR